MNEAFQRISGWRVVETRNLRWNQVIYARETRTMLCGERAHVVYILWIAAWREACREDLRRQLATLATRVGVDYSPPHASRRSTTTTRENRENP